MFHLMIDYLHRPVAHEAFFKKYASKKFLKGMAFTSLFTLIHILTDNHVHSVNSDPAMGQKVSFTIS